ncbi:hypothetical protein, partial [uncultured Oscillibacter sp.]|uniref:hypothetical protein n=1 Tax=uncultured Oscillibacter sp. TaxID=876091 RepID=UPI0026065A89
TETPQRWAMSFMETISCDRLPSLANSLIVFVNSTYLILPKNASPFLTFSVKTLHFVNFPEEYYEILGIAYTKIYLKFRPAGARLSSKSSQGIVYFKNVKN